MEATQSTFSLLELFQMGGAIMWPLLFFSIATVAIALERTIYLIYHNLGLSDLQEEVEDYIQTDDLPGAREYLETLTKRRMGARLLLVLVKQPGLSEHQMEKAVETEAMNCINSLENGFNFLTALGSLSPLTGFLGTVTGMIGAFKSIAEAPEVNAQIVASGIYEALITTVFGLIIAIAAMIAHSLFTYIVDRFTAEAENTCSALITLLTMNNANREREREREREKAQERAREWAWEVQRQETVKVPQLPQKPTQADIISLEDYT